MAIWLIRAGSHGEYEGKFIQDNRVASVSVRSRKNFWAGRFSRVPGSDAAAPQEFGRAPQALFDASMACR